MRILVAGTGSIGRRHVANLQLIVPQAQFIFVRRNARPNSFATDIGGEIYESLEEAVAYPPDLGVIANPSAHHLTTMIPLLRKGIPLYIEKPIVTTAEDADTLRGLLREMAAIPTTLVGCNLRFLPSLTMLKSILQAGTIGRLIRAHLEVGQWLPDWRPAQDYRESYSADPLRGGGVVMDLIHELDMACFLFGDLEFVAAAGGKFSSLDIATEDAAIVLLSRERGPVVAVGLDYVARRPVRRYEIIGEEGTAEWDLFAGRLAIVRRNDTEEVDCGPYGFDMAETYRTAMRALLLSISDGTATSSDIHEGLRSAEIAIRARDMIAR